MSAIGVRYGSAFTHLTRRQAQLAPAARDAETASTQIFSASQAPCRVRRASGPAPRQAQTVHWTVGVRDRRDDLQLGAAVRPAFEINLKAKLQRRPICTQVMSQPKTRLSRRRPTHPHRPVVRTVRLAGTRLRCLNGLGRVRRQHHHAQLGIGCQRTSATIGRMCSTR